MIDPELTKQFRDRWQAVAAVEAEEQRAASIELRWKQLNALWQLAVGLGLRPEPDETENQVRERWARLKRGLP
jgi:hypothetical protein